MRSILLLPLVTRCLETIDVCIWRMFVFVSVVVSVWGSVGMLCSGRCKKLWVFEPYIYIYYRFIVRFPIWLDFPLITLPFQVC